MGKALETVFADTVSDVEVERLLNERYNTDDIYQAFHVLPRSDFFWLCAEDKSGKLHWLNQIAKITALSKAESFKGGVYNNVGNIFVDEFITEEGYVGGKAEPERLDKIVNTIARKENKHFVRVFMAGNPDASIEMCPYLEMLQLDYAHLQPNTIYYYDTITPTGKRLANNVMFIKLANFSGTAGEYLNEHTSNVWNTAEGNARITGEVKTNKYMSVDDDLIAAADSIFELVVETAVRADDEYNRKIYGYICEIDEKPVLVILRHRNKKLSENADVTVFCRYDELKPRKHDCDTDILRLRIPRADEEMQWLARLLGQALDTRRIYAEDDQSGTLFEAIFKLDN